ncbi:hypothetical protein GCK32_022511 [Trichostrongylus colubriformis]|uniref:Uncharacterized protein n=1 Tax=Trichostrongylus colubriformis TaxID=6319 RepID=A0AAN8FLX4_TRICO
MWLQRMATPQIFGNFFPRQALTLIADNLFFRRHLFHHILTLKRSFSGIYMLHIHKSIDYAVHIINLSG